MLHSANPHNERNEMNTHSEPEWITTSEAAALTGYSLNYIRRLVREKRVPAAKWQRD